MENEIENVFENRKEFMIHLLKFLNEKPKGVELGEFFFSIMPSHGIENFQEILQETEKKPSRIRLAADSIGKSCRSHIGFAFDTPESAAG